MLVACSYIFGGGVGVVVVVVDVVDAVPLLDPDDGVTVTSS